jgi:predicted ABC-type ATPase
MSARFYASECLHNCGTEWSWQDDFRAGISAELRGLHELRQRRPDCPGYVPILAGNRAFRAGRLVLNEIDLFAQHRADFGFETTLSGRSYLRLIRRLKDQGYAVHFFFLWLSRVDLALSRIEARVLQGGHDVPEADVRRRFDRSIKNFLESYRPLGDSWYLFDNSLGTPAPIALEEGGRLRIMKPDTYKALVAQYGKHD